MLRRAIATGNGVVVHEVGDAFLARAHLPDEKAERAWQDGKAMSVDDAVALIREGGGS
jgi:hypothetical protein